MASTLTYDSVPEARGIPAKGIGILIAGLVLGAAIGLAVANYSTATDAPEVSVTGMAFDDFIRLNTTSFNGLAPVATAAVVDSVPPVNPRFVEINTVLPEYPVASTVAVDPHFLEMNVGSLDGSVPVAATGAAAAVAVDPGFLEMNIGQYEYPAKAHTEPLSGIR